VDTPHGPARVHLHDPGAPPRAGLVLGHGAGAGVVQVHARRSVRGVHVLRDHGSGASMGW